MSQERSPIPATDQVRARIEEWLDAVRAGDLDRLTRHYAPEAIVFDAVTNLQFRGGEDCRQHWAGRVSGGSDPVALELHALRIDADGALSLSHCLIRCSASDPSGRERVAWLRATTSHRRTAGFWQITHQHLSMPVDMHAGEARMALIT